MRKNKLLLLLALLMTAATGAWAQGPYTVAGSNAAMFGTAWDPTNTANDMTKNGDGTYSITYTNVYLTEEGVKYKVVKDHSWNEAYPNNDRVITIAEAGTYTLTIHFNPTTHEVYETMPGYTVSLADGTEEPTLWSASPAADVKKGQTVTVTYSGTKKVIGVKAEKKAKAVPVTSITLNKTATSIKVGSTETLSVTAVAPDNATDKTYTWKTSDETKATVDQDGKVTAVAAGTVTIYAEANDGSGVKGNCTVTVSKVVTINLSDWGERGQRSFTKDGVTVSAGMIDPVFGELGGDITISTTLGIFTKIVVTAEECYASGTGWSGDESTRTWAGTPASTVSFRGEFVGRDSNPTTIVCTIVP